MGTHIIPPSFRKDGSDEATFFVPHICLKSPGVKAVDSLSIQLVRSRCELADGEQLT